MEINRKERSLKRGFGITFLVILFLTFGAEAAILTVDDSGVKNIWDESSGSLLPFTWNSTNFDGFNISGIGTENLTVFQTDLASTQRIINKNNLTYSTTARPRKLNVVTALNLTDNTVMMDKGLEQASSTRAFDNGEYYIVNWQAQKYVALNGKVDKLAKLVIEQGLSEKKSLRVGETWNVGGGWALTANSIDARVSPRQVWLTLSKDGVKKDDKVVTSGGPTDKPIYTYVEKSIGGETDVPLFVTYVDFIFDGTTSDIVEFRYTWALSTSITEINSYTTYGVFRGAMVSWRTLTLRNSDISIALSPDATINLIGNIKFKVIDNSTYLKFYPTDEPKLNITASSGSIAVGTPERVIFNVTVNGSPINGAMVNLNGAAVGSGITDSNGHAEIYINATYDGTITVDSGKAGYTNGSTSLHSYSSPIAAMGSWSLEENYILNLTDIETKSYSKLIRLQLSKDGILVEEDIVTQGSIFKYCPNDCTILTTVDVIFSGTQGNLVKLVNTSQYSEGNGTQLLSNVSHLYKSGNFTGISWLLNDGYELRMMDIDTSYPRLVWLELFKNNTLVDDAFIPWGKKYFYNNTLGSTIITAKVDAIFNGETSSAVKLTEVNQYSETTGAVLLDNSTHFFITGVIKRADQPLYEGYILSVLGIDVHGYPSQTWLRMYKDGTLVDEKIAALGDVYRYENQSRTVLFAEINFIFAGRPVSALKLDNVTQYSEMNGSELISGATYIIVVNGSLFPIPSPTITPIPEYGTYEVRGTAASEMASEGAINLSAIPIIWDPQNFAGFYYDLNYNLGKEELKILQPDLSSNQRTIAKGNLVYRTSAQPKKLNVVKYAFGDNIISAAASGLKRTGSGQVFEGGNYYILGWQGEEYIALNGKVDKLTRLILEQGTSAAYKKTLTPGETWLIGDNWTITLQSINARSSPRLAWLVLGRDGVKKDDIFVSSGAFSNPIYTYVEKNISNESDVPLFVTYLDSVFAGATTEMVQLRYTWLISTSINEIKSDDTYGKFKDASVIGRTILLKNTESTVSLTRDTTIDLMRNMKFRVADNDTLRFMPVAEHASPPGIYEIRGIAWNETPINGFGGTGRTAIWNVSNFAGFFYDIHSNLGKEELHLLQTDLSAFQRTIIQNNLVYSTDAQPKMLNVVKYKFSGNVSAAEAAGLERTAPWQAFEGGNYYIVGWVGEKYVAVNGKIDKLAKLIIEHGKSAYEKKTLTVGETWEVGDGWTLTANSIDAKATPRQVWLTLSKDGVKKDDKVITSGGTDSKPIYTYVEKSLGGENDVPVFVTYVDSVFAGATTDMVQLRYTWAISESVTQINSGNTYGVFKDGVVAGKTLALKNSDAPISLTRDSIVNLMGNMMFKVADSDILRFMPVVVHNVDTYPSGSVTSLRAISYGPDHIKWGWNDPTEPVFDHVQVYIDGTFKNNVPKGIQFYNATGFAPNTGHTIATRTVDISGNLNPNWVNNTVWTANGNIYVTRIMGYKFSEPYITIRAGDTLQWYNLDDDTKTLVEADGKISNITVYSRANYVFSATGTYTFKLFYPDMRVEPPVQTVVVLSNRTIYFNNPAVTMPQNASRSLNLILNYAPNGLSGYNITISLSNSSVANVTSVDFPAWAALHSNSSLPSGSVWIKAADLNHEISNGANNVILANVTVRGDNRGYSKITTTIGQMDDDSGAIINPQTLESYIEVNALRKFPDMIEFPGDPDVDGLYEDMNGNGRKDFNDVVLFFDHLEWIMDNEPVESFDFNHNGRIDFADIVKLYEEI